MKCPQEKCWTDERPTKKYWTHETPTKKIVDQQISTRKNFGPRKYPPEKFRAHESTMAWWHETHETHDGARLTEFSTLYRYWQPTWGFMKAF